MTEPASTTQKLLGVCIGLVLVGFFVVIIISELS